MKNFFLGNILILALLVLLSLYRGIWGPGFLNRLAAVNVIGTKIVVLLALVGFVAGRIDMFIDICLAYALLNFIGTLAAAKYLERKGVI